MLDYLEWDSDFFSQKIGRISALEHSAIDLDEAITRAVKLDFDLVYIFSNPLNAEVNSFLAKKGAFLADRKRTYLRTLYRVTPGEDGNRAIVNYSKPEPSSQLISLALQSGIYSRFALDKRFKEDDFRRLYTAWIEQSVKGKLAREVLVYQADNTELGLLTLGEKAGRTDIGLLAVDEAARGQAIGKKMIAEAFRKSINWGFSEIQVVTQEANEGACRFYERCGFNLEKTEYIYHLWL